MLRNKRINSTFYTDTMFATDKAKSIRGNKGCQYFVSDKGCVAVYPMESVSQFEDALQLFCNEVGFPTTMVADPHPSQTKKSIRRFCDQVGMSLRLLEKHTQWANRALTNGWHLKVQILSRLQSLRSHVIFKINLPSTGGSYM